MSKWFGYTGGYAAGGGSPGPPPKGFAAVAPKKNMVDIDEVIEYLDGLAESAAGRGQHNVSHSYLWAATALHAHYKTEEAHND